MSEGRVIGVLALYSDAPHAFKDDEMELLGQMARDIAFALLTIEQDRARRAAEETVTRLAYHDPLTGLPNRLLLLQRLTRLLEAQPDSSATSVAVLVINLREFGRVNQVFGYQNGDRLLCEAGERLRVAVMDSDLLAHVGGSAFAVVLPEVVSEEHARLEAGTLLGALMDTPFSFAEMSIEARANVGIAMFPQHGKEAEALMRRAETALGEAKRGSGECVVFSPELEFDPRRLTLVTALRHALEQEALQLHYQPKVDIRTGEMTGVEALARWPHPERGFVPPDEFVPLAEQTGLINLLTHWALDTALRQSTRWRRNRMALRMAVNVSARNMCDTRFPDDVAGLLRKHHVPPAWLMSGRSSLSATIRPTGARSAR